MGAADPTYPLFPVASFLAVVMLLLVLITSFLRHTWNLGVTFLCFWLCIGNLTGAVNAIIWSDNADVKFNIYCDIGTSPSPVLTRFQMGPVKLMFYSLSSVAHGRGYLCC